MLRKKRIVHEHDSLDSWILIPKSEASDKDRCCFEGLRGNVALQSCNDTSDRQWWIAVREGFFKNPNLSWVKSRSSKLSLNQYCLSSEIRREWWFESILPMKNGSGCLWFLVHVRRSVLAYQIEPGINSQLIKQHYFCQLSLCISTAVPLWEMESKKRLVLLLSSSTVQVLYQYVYYSCNHVLVADGYWNSVAAYSWYFIVQGRADGSFPEPLIIKQANCLLRTT